jgi:BlaI family transcriptional regulator, penicillinase repressor
VTRGIAHSVVAHESVSGRWVGRRRPKSGIVLTNGGCVKILTLHQPLNPRPAMAKTDIPQLSKRERQIMDAIYRRGRATAAEVRAEMPDAPTYTTVRGLLRILERKGHLRHQEQGTKFVYSPSLPRQAAGTSILSHIVRTFFDGSAASAMAAMLGSSERSMNGAELERLSELVKKERRKLGKRNGKPEARAR